MLESELQEIVRRLVARACEGQQVESSHVELKSQWPTAKEGARDIAALCNAAGLEPVLFIVGVNEREKQVLDTSPVEVANWWKMLGSEFDREVPELQRVSTVHIGDQSVVALLIGSSRPPYVIKNPKWGEPGCGPVNFEVPWREGNANRSARREHLLRLIVPAVGVPDLELLSGYVSYSPSERETWAVNINLEVFASLRRPATLVGHKTKLSFDPDHLGPQAGVPLDRRFGDSIFGGPENLRALDLNGTTSFRFIATGYSGCAGPVLPPQVTLKIEFAIDRSERTALLEVKLRQRLALPHSIDYEPIL